MTILRKLGKWAVIIYVTQAVVGVMIGVYLAATLDPSVIKGVLDCVG